MRSPILSRYLLRQMLAPLVGALLLITGLIWILQALRLGHHLIGAGPLALGQILLYSLPFLLAFAFPLALAAAILLVLGRLKEGGELLALQAAGAAPLQLAAPALLLCLGGAISVYLLAEWVQPKTLPHLGRLLSRSGTQTLLQRSEPGRFHRLLDNTTLFVQQRRPGPAGEVEISGLLLAQERPSLLLVARRARLSPHGDLSLRLELWEGELQRQRAEGDTRGLQRLRFERMSLTLNLGAALQRHLGFIARLAEDRSPLTGPLSCLALGLLVSMIGLGRGSRWRIAATGIAAVAAFQFGIWGAQVVSPGAPGAEVFVVCVGGICWGRLATT